MENTQEDILDMIESMINVQASMSELIMTVAEVVSHTVCGESLTRIENDTKQLSEAIFNQVKLMNSFNHRAANLRLIQDSKLSKNIKKEL